jgi:hypothetical protein
VTASKRVRERATEVLAWELSIGYASRDELIDFLTDALADDDLEVDDSVVGELVDEALVQRQREEDTWHEPTGHDRLVAAFADLDSSGIVSRECYGVTVRDAENEVREEAERIAATAVVRGTCTFDIQDAEGAASGGLLYLSYASFASDDDAVIGMQIVETLRRHGLEVQWSGLTSDRIGVRIPDWRVRRTTKL